MRPDILKYIGTLVASTMLLMLVVVLPATATDLSIGSLTYACEGTEPAVSWTVTTDRTGDEAAHPMVRVQWRPESGGTWQTLGEGALTADNGYVYSDSASGVDFGDATTIDVRARAVPINNGGANWGDGRPAGDTYTSTLNVVDCNPDDPTQNTRVNWSAGCRTSPTGPTIMLFNDGDPNTAAPIEYVVNATMDGVNFTKTVTVQPGGDATVEKVALVFDDNGTILDPEDRTIAVTVNVGDRTEFKRTFTVDCEDDAPVAPTATMLGTCSSNGYQVVVEVAYDGPTATPVVITIDGVEVASGDITGDKTYTFDVPGDGTYAVVVTAGGDVIASDDVIVDCDDEPTSTVEFTQICDNGEGKLTVSVTTDSTAPVEFVVTIDGVVVDTFTLADGSDDRSYAVEDGTRTIVVTADGTEIGSESFEVDCDVPVPAEPSASILGDCGDVDVDGGVITVTANNTSVTSAAFTILIDGVEVDSFDLADGTETRTFDVDSGTYDVVVKADGETVASNSSLVIDCDVPVPAEPSASILGDCGDVDVDGGVITVTANNTSVTSAAFTILIDGVEVDSFDLADGTETRTFDVDSGTYDVVVKADGETVASNSSLVIDCDVPVPAEPSASILGDCGDVDVDGGVITVTANNTSVTSAAFTILIDGVEVDSFDLADGTETRTFDVDSGTYDVVVKADGETVASNSSLVIDCDVPVPAEPSASILGDCGDVDVDGGVITVTTMNDSITSATFMIYIDGALKATFDLADGTDVRTFDVDSGTYDVVVKADGETVASDPAVVIDCDVVLAEPSASVLGDCADVFVDTGVITVTSDNPSVTPATFTIYLDGTLKATFDLAEGTDVRTFETGNGLHTVRIEADGVEIANEAININCIVSPPAEPTASVLGACDDTRSSGGVLTFALDNATDAPLDFFITATPALGDAVTQTVTVPAETAEVVTIAVPAEIYAVTVVADGIDLVDEDVDVSDCVEVQAATVELSCDTATGVSTLTVTNTEGSASTFMVQIMGVEYDLGTIAPGETGSVELPLDNGTYAYELYRDGVRVDLGTIMITCNPPTAPSASSMGECGDLTVDGGEITVTSTNDSITSATFTIYIDGVLVATFDLADDTDVRTFDVDSGTYEVVVKADGVTVDSNSIDVDCDVVLAEPSASVLGDCAAVDVDAGLITVTADNASVTPATFTIYIDGVLVATFDLADGTDVRDFSTDNGVHTVVVKADGVEIANDEITINCIVSPPAEPEASVLGACDDTQTNGGVLTFTLDNKTDAPLDFVITATPNAGDAVTQTVTVAAETIDTVTIAVPAEIYAVTVVADGIDLVDEDVDVSDCVEPPAEPSASALGDCGDVDVDGGVITVTTNNTSATSATFTILIDGVEVDSFDLADGTDVRTFDVDSGTYEVVVLADGETISTDAIIIDCETSPPAEPEASVLGSCDDLANRGVLTFVLDNPTDAELDFDITATSGTGEVITETVTVPAAGSDNVVIPVPAEIYGVTVVADGVTLVDEDVDVSDCVEVQGSTLETSCNTITGETTLTVRNTEGSDSNFVVQIMGVEYDLGLIASGETGSIILTLDNGTYAFELYRDGVQADFGTFMVSCNPATPGEPAASVLGACDETSSNGGGLLTVDLANPTDEAVTFVVTATEDIAGTFTETVTVAANSTDTLTLPVAAGIYEVVVTADDAEILDTVVDLTDCTPVQAFTIGVECATGGIARATGTFEYTVAGDYVLTVGSATADLGTIAANEEFSFSLPVSSGTQAYSLARDGVEVESGNLPIPVCVDDTTIANTGLSTDLLVPAALAMLMLGFGMVAFARRRDAI